MDKCYHDDYVTHEFVKGEYPELFRRLERKKSAILNPRECCECGKDISHLDLIHKNALKFFY